MRRDVPAVARVLAAAFADDPVLRWLRPDGRGRELLFRTLARRTHASSGCADVAERDGVVVGAALWDPPTYRCSRWQRVQARPVLLAALGSRAPYGETLQRALAENRPSGAFWYLAQLGALERGVGIGSQLLRARLGRILGPAYLECSTERAIGLYERFGFRVTGEIKIDAGGPVCWTMYRDAVS